MASVENLYWILYENLLRPVGLDAWYFYPFGTTQHLSQSEFQTDADWNAWTPGKEHHVLFYHDQEPIWDNQSCTHYDSWHRVFWSDKLLKILANSEHSLAKEKMCQGRGMQDWYFFFHGLASLNWFRDSKYIPNRTADIQYHFCSLNHQVRKKRAYRMALTARLIESDLISNGLVSFHGNQQDCADEIEDRCSLLDPSEKTLIQKHLCHGLAEKKIVDASNIDGSYSAVFGHREYSLWQKSFCHLVNETVFYDQKLHLTEKIFKPIVAMRPFILVSAAGNLEYLRSYGFKTFGPWIDESYDQVADPVLRLELITQELQKICQRSPADIEKLYGQMLPILEHNKNHFFGNFRHIVINELVDNFDKCTRIWNNGRVDGRQIAAHPDLGSVKKILLG